MSDEFEKKMKLLRDERRDALRESGKSAPVILSGAPSRGEKRQRFSARRSSKTQRETQQ